MAFEAYPKSKNVFRVVLEEAPEGTYVFVFESEKSIGPEKDYLQADLDMAKRSCLRKYAIDADDWIWIPNSGLRG
jgi:hypothetical protein